MKWCRHAHEVLIRILLLHTKADVNWNEKSYIKMHHSSFWSMKCAVVLINCGLPFFCPCGGAFCSSSVRGCWEFTIQPAKKIVIKSACESSLIYLSSEFFSFLFSCCFFRLYWWIYFGSFAKIYFRIKILWFRW